MRLSACGTLGLLPSPQREDALGEGNTPSGVREAERGARTRLEHQRYMSRRAIRGDALSLLFDK
jgi:hypothetical protein